MKTVSPSRPQAPNLSTVEAARIADELFGVRGEPSPLASYIDQNFLIRSPGASWVLKVANTSERMEVLDFQNQAMLRVSERERGLVPNVMRSVAGREIETIHIDGEPHFVRLVSFLEGELLCDADRVDGATWTSLGKAMARIDRALEGWEHPAMRRSLRWDLALATWTIGAASSFTEAQRKLIEYHQLQFQGHVMRRLDELPKNVIFNDANDHNLVVSRPEESDQVTGVFDFGDIVYTARIFEVAIACAYAMLDREDPFENVAHIVKGYHELLPLTDSELEALFPAIGMRLVTSVTISTQDARVDPENEYIRISAVPAWRALDHLASRNASQLVTRLRRFLGLATFEEKSLPRETVLILRQEHVGSALSLSYDQPIEIVQGRGQYLFDKGGRAYLDCVNNVCHVGHCHPHVVAAAQAQIAKLNTNTRYLHDTIVRYAERLTALFPDPLSVCFLVNSGSEANELALRLARAATGRHDMLVQEAGYHGHTSALVDLSHYKHAGPGGRGAPDWVHLVPCPDPYRGPYREQDPEAGEKYASGVAHALSRAQESGRPIAGFLAEPLIGCGGQVVPPDGYLRWAFEHARAQGAIPIADEIQIGFGRVGTHMWAFEAQGALPDIVTLGKPIGNGHPMAAVITTPEIAATFDNGMEFFSTFGGNPVSCAIGMAVLDVIEQEHLMENAHEVGQRLMNGFQDMAERHPILGDVRGQGLYLGVDLVHDRETRLPAGRLLARAIETARETGVLLSADGPHANVLKIKPPMTFGPKDADLLLSVFERALEAL